MGSGPSIGQVMEGRWLEALDSVHVDKPCEELALLTIRHGLVAFDDYECIDVPPADPLVLKPLTQEEGQECRALCLAGHNLGLIMRDGSPAANMANTYAWITIYAALRAVAPVAVLEGVPAELHAPAIRLLQAEHELLVFLKSLQLPVKDVEFAEHMITKATFLAIAGLTL